MKSSLLASVLFFSFVINAEDKKINEAMLKFDGDVHSSLMDKFKGEDFLNNISTDFLESHTKNFNILRKQNVNIVGYYSEEHKVFVDKNSIYDLANEDLFQLLMQEKYILQGSEKVKIYQLNQNIWNKITKEQKDSIELKVAIDDMLESGLNTLVGYIADQELCGYEVSQFNVIENMKKTEQELKDNLQSITKGFSKTIDINTIAKNKIKELENTAAVDNIAKNELEIKMQEMQENLNRIKKEKAEEVIDFQSALETLKNKKAELESEVEEVKNELSSVNTTQENIDDMQKIKKELEESLNQKDAAITELTSKLNSYKENVQQAEQEKTDFKNNINKLKSEKSELTNAIDIITKANELFEFKLNAANTEKVTLQENLESIMQEKSELQETVNSIESDMQVASNIDAEEKNELQNQVIELQNKLDTIENERLLESQNQLSAREDAIQKAINEQHKLNNLLVNAGMSRDNLQKSIKDIENTKIQLQTQLNTTQQEKSELEAQIKTMQEKSTQDQANIESTAKIAKDKIAAMHSQTKKLEGKLADSIRQDEVSVTMHKNAEAEIKKLQNDLNAVQTNLENKITETNALKGELSESQSNMQTAIESAAQAQKDKIDEIAHLQNDHDEVLSRQEIESEYHLEYSKIQLKFEYHIQNNLKRKEINRLANKNQKLQQIVETYKNVQSSSRALNEDIEEAISLFRNKQHSEGFAHLYRIMDINNKTNNEYVSPVRQSASAQNTKPCPPPHLNKLG
ncbi:coiled-coil domain-containing protein [Candidatus Cytomitobacter primus]|uniref:Uncharacterized protein n=1 Tax=Candidatus Cytomitobacter primus TaxID=2066024 RepID=A0A5C0UFT2_9PROT|nr:hypothetical protein [Candidatus Cytomitobacter primus]QEK38580.1 hypothetical protein FZC34_01485 [Candidatus Cytomitobacter primus]